MHGDERLSGGERDALDERIDAALRRYVETPQFPEPRVALARVRSLEEERPRRQWSVWVWVVPSLVAAAVIALVLVWVLRVPQEPQIAWVPKAPAVAASVAQPKLPQGEKEDAGPRDSNRCCDEKRGAAIGTLAQADRGFVRARELRLPKLEVFPTPEPLSPEERALLALATQAPPAVTKQVIEAQEHLGDPIQIAAITIRPLNDQQAAPKGKEIR